MTRPRCPHYEFAHVALRSVAFAEPLRFMVMVASPEAEVVFAHLIKQVNEICKVRGKDGGGPAGFSAGQIGVHTCRVADHPCAVIVLPTPRAMGEAYYVALVLLTKGEREMVGLRYFTFEHSTAYGGQGTVLGEWLKDGTHINFGPGPEPSVEAFLGAMDALLRG